MFKGSNVALITPFRDGAVDEQAFADLIEWHITEGTHGLVPVGTTGESPTLSHEEHNRVTEICVEVADHRLPVIAGTGSNSTDEAISLTSHAKQAGADAVLVVTPYYNKPTQEGLYRHYKAIHDAVDIPIQSVEPGAMAPGEPAGEATRALGSLGFKPQEAQRMVRAVVKPDLSAEDIIRLALRQVTL